MGGDLSYQMGCIESIHNSGNPLASCSLSGALPGYLPLYGTLVAGFAHLSGEPVPTSMLAMAVLLRGTAIAVACVLLIGAFGATPGLLLACLWALVRPETILKYTEFSAALVVPIFYYTLLSFLARPAASRALLLGLALAVAGYSHSVVFVGGAFVTAGCILFSALTASERRATALVLGLRYLVIVAGVAALSLGYWYKPIFVHHGRTSLHYTEWNGGVSLATLPNRLAFAGSALTSLVRLDQWPMALRNALLLLSVPLCLNRRIRARHRPAIIAAGATVVCSSTSS